MTAADSSTAAGAVGRVRHYLLMLTAWLFFFVRTASAQWALDGVDNVVAISDIHGAHQAFVETLQAAGVVDEHLAWSSGQTHLVIVGDILDRGDDSRQSMDLLMRLEGEAAAAGGRVHVVLGNHELMNLVGDLRYVARGEYAAFAADESAALRDTAFVRAQAADSTLTREAFDDRYPPGYFGHRAAFAANGRYGRWLLEKPLVLRINDTLFVHAGMSNAMNEMDLDAINGGLRNELIDYLQALEQANRDGILDATVDFYAVPALLENFPGRQEVTAVMRLLALHDSMIHDTSSPLWYRGNVGCGPLIEQDRLASALARFGSRRVVIGHTPTFRHRIWHRLDQQVLTIDAGMLRTYYNGQGAALKIAGGEVSAVYQGSPDAHAIDAMPSRTGVLGAGLTADELEAVLQAGDVAVEDATTAVQRVRVSAESMQLPAVFMPASKRQKAFPEVAAYRIDRLLELDMVPVAVRRTINGQDGTLIYLPQAMISETQRVAERINIPAWCPLPDQFNALYLFDALIDNQPRTGEDLLYSRANGELVLVGHRDAFGTGTGLPRHLAGVSLAVTPLWREKLERLAGDGGVEILGDVLSQRAIKALAKRAAVLAAR